MNEVRLYGKNKKHPAHGRRYWTNIEAWKKQRVKATGNIPAAVNVTTVTKEWSRSLSPMVLGPIDTYEEKGKMLRAVTVEVAWQYSKVYSHENIEGKLVPLKFRNPDGKPNKAWFAWRDRAWANPKFREDHPQFQENKKLVRRAFPKGSKIAAWYWGGRLLDAVTARREIYASLYCNAVRSSPAYGQLKDLCSKGDVVIYDIDGYDYVSLAMSPEDTIQDLEHSWGHGLLLTLMLNGVDPLTLGKIPKVVVPPVPISFVASASPITFTAADLPYGWLGNMAGGYPIRFKDVDYRSTEGLFQCMRFPGDQEAQDSIRSATSPLWSKKRATPRAGRLKMAICDKDDLARMKVCLVLKLGQNPQLIAPLLGTGLETIIEDCAAREDDIEIDGTNYFFGKPFWGAVNAGAAWEGNNALGKVWMEIRDELRAKGKAVAVSPSGDTVVVQADTPLGKGAFAPPPLTAITPLSAAETARLKACEDRIEKGRKAVEQGFIDMVEAMHEVYQHRLYRVGGRTFAAYFRDKWKFQRAHSYRLIHCGRLLQTMKGAVLDSLNSQAHFRPLLSAADDTIIEAAIHRIEAWKSKEPALDITPRVVASAVELVGPVPTVELAGPSAKLSAEAIVALVEEAQEQAKKKGAFGAQIVENLRKNIDTLIRKGTSAIGWTDDTWNPLQGCHLISDGCKNCYAATLLATRMKAKFPGIAEENLKAPKGSSPYRFTGKVQLLVRMLGEPLQQRRPRRYFVNSLSDLFYEGIHDLHEGVPDWFIDEVFNVMEKAHWHQFQVLTKRPKRMAEYTTKRYPDGKAPKNIWLGCSMESQKEHDRRMKHLNEVVAAVRWVSAEPLLDSAIRFDLSKVNWVVVGGESGGYGRKMEKAWVSDIYRQCKKASVPFFFKQWGDFGEDGKPAKRKAGKGHDTLDGKIIHEYPAS
jgi:protein gp37/predicted NAD-dependent protein-ADP-ribosyltransferase YbiA (DUF1768 family)